MLSRAIGLAVILTILGKILAFLKEVVLAYYFGTSAATDAYFISNFIPGIVWLAIYSTIASAFMPMYIERKERGDSEAAKFINSSIRFYFYISLVVAVPCFIFAREIVFITAPHSPADTLNLATKLTRIMVIAFVFTSYVGIQNSVQQANGRFIAPLAVPVVNNFIAVVGIVVAAYFDSIVFAVSAATFAWLAQAVLQRLQTKQFYRAVRGIKVDSIVWRRLTLLSAPIAVAIFLDQVNILIGIALASAYGDGAISHLNYASRLALFAAGLFSWLVSYFLFPVLARNAARRDDAENGYALTRGFAMILLATAPLAAASLALKVEIVMLVYGRGEFAGSDVEATSGLFGIYGIGIIFISLRELLNRVFFSYQRTIIPLVIGVFSAGVNFFTSIFLSKHFGVDGVAMGATMASVSFFFLQVLMIFRWKKVLITKDSVRVLVSTVVASVVAYFSVGGVLPYLSGFGVLSRLCLGSLFIAAIYAGVGMALAQILGLNFARIVHILTKPKSIGG